MKGKVLIFSVVILIFGLLACQQLGKPEQGASKAKPTLQAMPQASGTYISIFEIPATDISRAIGFYEAILDISIEPMEMANLQMGILPYEGQLVAGVILQGEGYEPSSKGVTVYLNGGDDLQTILDKVEKSGGKILVPKTPHADEVGFFAIFQDSEGNRLGLHSPL